MKPLLEREFSRRTFLFSSMGGAVALSHTPKFSDTTLDLELTNYQIPIRNLPSEFLNYRIGFISDVHLGLNLPPDFVEEAFRKVSEAKIDLLVLGGDMLAVNNSTLGDLASNPRNVKLRNVQKEFQPPVIFSQLTPIVSRFIPRDGALAIYGNHEWWVAPQLFQKEFSGIGVKVLRNESFALTRGSAKVDFYGVDDFWNGSPRKPDFPKRTTENAPTRILLSHNPDYVVKLLSRVESDFDLAMCGHTHGGQIILPVIGALTYNIKNIRFGSGLAQHPAGPWVFTSRGVGVVEIPYRINCRPEVSVVELTAAS